MHKCRAHSAGVLDWLRWCVEGHAASKEQDADKIEARRVRCAIHWPVTASVPGFAVHFEPLWHGSMPSASVACWVPVFDPLALNIPYF